MPDIDSLPAPFSSPRTNDSENRHSPSPRASSASLAAAAAINAGLQQEDSRRSSSNSTRDRSNASSQFGQNERRRSNAFLNSHDPTLPGPGELQTGDLRLQTSDLPSPRMIFGTRTASPHGSGSPTFPPSQYRGRTPSLGEIHQQLEQEQEAQVIRLLGMIRQGQAELQAIRQQATPGSHLATIVGESSPPLVPSTERSASYPFPSQVQPSNPQGNTLPQPGSPVVRGSNELSRPSSHRSRTPSRAASPSFRTLPAGIFGPGDDFLSAGIRSQALVDENHFYQWETQSLRRDNQLLKQRIRELERQLNEGNSTTVNSPVTSSNLSVPPIEADNSEAVLASEDEGKDG